MKSWKTTLFQAAAVTGLVAYGATAQANPGSSENMLSERIDALEAQLAELLIVQDEAAAAAAPAPSKSGEALEASWKNGLKLSNADGSSYVKLFGRVQWDALFFQEDRDVRLALGKQADGVLARRMRIGVGGRQLVPASSRK